MSIIHYEKVLLTIINSMERWTYRTTSAYRGRVERWENTPYILHLMSIFYLGTIFLGFF